jgi:hypothetical protein
MMRERLLALRERRARLVADAESRRVEVFALIDRADQVAHWLDRARDLGRKASSHPVWIAAGVALVVAFRPRRAFKLAATGISLWRGWRSLRSAIDRFVPLDPRRAPIWERR